MGNSTCIHFIINDGFDFCIWYKSESNKSVPLEKTNPVFWSKWWSHNLKIERVLWEWNLSIPRCDIMILYNPGPRYMYSVAEQGNPFRKKIKFFQILFAKFGFENIENNLLNLWYNLAAIWLIPTNKFEYNKMPFELSWDNKDLKNAYFSKNGPCLGIFCWATPNYL
jgi:hypothetical protein